MAGTVGEKAMLRALFGFAVLLPAVVCAQPPAAAPVMTEFSAVAYVETGPSSAASARAALRLYGDAIRGQSGFVRVEWFEQVGRRGHFVVLETWRDQPAYEARDPAAQRDLLEGLEPIRVSGYDERPYKTLTKGAEIASTAGDTVYVITHVDVAPNPQVPVLLQRLAEASRGEAGNLRFDVLQHTQRANHFTVIEHWQSQQALDAHGAAAHTRQYRDELQPFTGSPLDERVYTVVR